MRWRCTISAKLSLAALNRKHKMEWLSIKTGRHELAWWLQHCQGSGIILFVILLVNGWNPPLQDENWTSSHIASTSQSSKIKGKGVGRLTQQSQLLSKIFPGTPPDILFHLLASPTWNKSCYHCCTKECRGSVPIKREGQSIE